MKSLALINRGGFGKVDKVKLSDGSIVARKIFSPEKDVLERSTREKLRARFIREVRVQQSLPSEFFLPILQFDLEADIPWFTMPLAERNYAQEIATQRQERKPVDWHALADILNALEELHSLGFVHRDLKPANVLLHEGLWKLSDFGFVQPAQENTTSLTSMQSGWGTAKYCAPEQAQDFRRSTAAVDIYSFGCLLHDVFSRSPRVPYQRHTCEGPVGWIIEKCTELDPAKRFRSVSALRDALFSVLTEDDSAAVSPESDEWVVALGQVESWSQLQAEEFARFLRPSGEPETRERVLRALDEHRLRQLNKLDPDTWSAIALHVCEWCQGNFAFEYCDVLVRRLEAIFDLGELECKAAAMIAAATLGGSHNRYFVMRRLLAMCGPGLDERLATRIAIEIRAGEAEENFRASARAIGKTIGEFHPKIADVLI